MVVRYRMVLILLSCFPCTFVDAENVLGRTEQIGREVLDNPSSDGHSRWEAFMKLGFVRQSRGQLRDSLEPLNSALAQAHALNNQFAIGRSLAFLGWTYAAMGRYGAALKFYEEAIALGERNGEIVHVHVWGLALQEKGNILWKLGMPKESKEALSRTTAYATAHQIFHGVAEGKAHLAEIALAEGELVQALKDAREAVESALHTPKAPLNIARAKTVYAKAFLAQAERSETELPKAKELIEESIRFSTEAGTTRYLAESLILRSRLLGPQLLKERVATTERALEILMADEHETRGLAAVEVGRTLLLGEDLRLAETYLRLGYDISSELLRKVDRAYSIHALADLRELQGNIRTELQLLEESVTAARTAGAYQQAFVSARQLADRLFDLRYLQLARRWTATTLELLGHLLSQQLTDVREAELLEAKATLLERLVAIDLELAPQSPG